MSCAKVSWFWDFLSYFRRQNKYKIRDSWPRDINLKTLVGTLLPRLAVAVCWVLCYVPIFSFYCSRFLWWRQIRHYIHNTVCITTQILPKFDSFFMLAFRLGFFIELNPQLSKKSARRLITVSILFEQMTRDDHLATRLGLRLNKVRAISLKSVSKSRQILEEPSTYELSVVQVFLYEINCESFYTITWIVLTVHKLNKLGKFW